MIENLKQRKILRELMKQNGQRYSLLSKNFKEEEKFSYHIKYLVKNGYVEKVENKYFIITKGADETENYDWTTLETIPKKTHVYLGLLCKHSNKYLLRQFTYHTFTGWYKIPSFLSGGNEAYKNGIEVIFHKYFNNQVDRKKFKYHSTHHRIVLNKDSSFAWDSYLIIFSAALDIKEVKVLNQIVQDGKWYTMSQIKKLQYQWPEVEIATSKIHKESFYEYKILPK